jgi:hypothetical protein
LRASGCEGFDPQIESCVGPGDVADVKVARRKRRPFLRQAGATESKIPTTSKADLSQAEERRFEMTPLKDRGNETAHKSA